MPPDPRPSRWSTWLLLLVPLLGVLVGYALRTAAGGPAPAASPAAAGSAPPLAFELAALDGGSVRASDLAGRVALLDFWASWCGPCKLQERILEPLVEEYGDRVAFLAVNLGEPEEVVRRHVEADPFAYRVVLDPAETVGTTLGIYALPTVAILDVGGRVRFLRQGVTGEVMLRRELDAALGAGRVAAAAGGR